MADASERESPTQPTRRSRLVGGSVRLIGREKELEALSGALERARGGSTELVTISGRSGVGKSTLLGAFTSHADMGLLGSGIYTVVPSGPQTGLYGALREVVRTMLGMADQVVDEWSAALAEALGPGADELASLVPELEAALGDQPTPQGTDVGGALNRLTRATTALVAESARVAGPLVLILDDMQWADPSEIDFIGTMLSSRPGGLLFIGAWRAMDASGIDRLARSPQLHATRLDLQPLNRRGIQAWLEETIGGAVTTDLLAMVEQRTEGNPLYLEQLARNAETDGALTFDVASGTWRWDPEWLREQPVTEGLAELFASSMHSLPDRQRQILAAAACIGGRFTLADAVIAAADEAQPVAEALWAGITAGFLISDSATGPMLDTNVSYRFAHDRIVDAAQLQLTERERHQTHLRIGRAFRDDEARIFEAVTHLALGVEAMEDTEERVSSAHLARRAGGIARRQASFSQAHEYFGSGLELLRGVAADPEDDLVPDLRFGHAEAAWLIGDNDLGSYVESAWADSADVAHRARMAALAMRIDLARHQAQRALDTGRSMLEELGVPLPSSTSRGALLRQLTKTALALRGMTDDDIDSLEPATDPVAVAAAPIITEMFSTSYTAAPDVFPFVVLHAVDLTLRYGRVPVSPVAIAGYGLLQVVLSDSLGTGRLEAAGRFGKLAMRMADRSESLDHRPWVHFLNFNFVHHWLHPLSEGLSPVQDAFEEALQRGDLEYAGYLAAVELSQRFNVGTPLPDLYVRGQELITSFPAETKQVEICEAISQLAASLMGLSPDPTVLAGSTSYDERQIVPVAEEQNDVVSLAVHASVKLGLEFWSGDVDAAAQTADRMDEYMDGLTATSSVPSVTLISTLARLRTSPTDRDTRKRAAKTLTKFKKWAELNRVSFNAGVALIETELERARGNHRKAEEHANAAIEAAEATRIPSLLGLAYQTAADIYEDTNRTSAARGLISQAARIWQQLGMKVRLDRMVDRYPWLAEEVADLDVEAAVGRGSGDLEGLVRGLLSKVLEVSGATRSLLILTRDGTLELQAVATPSGVDIQDPPQPVTDSGPYAASLVRYAFRTRQRAVVDAAGPSHPDPYVAGGNVRSMAVVPITHRSRVISAVVVEDSQREGRFNDEVCHRIAALGQEVGVTIENAMLERQLEETQRERTALEEARARYIPPEWAVSPSELAALESGESVSKEWSILFSDIWGFSALSEEMTTDEINEVVGGFMRSVEIPIKVNNGYVLDVRGDEVIALFPNGPQDAIAGGLGMLRAQAEFNQQRADAGKRPVRWGVGVNHGEVILGQMSGVDFQFKGALGDAMNLASRVQSLTRRYDTPFLVSDHALSQIEQPNSFHTRRAEKVQVYNKDESVTIYEVYDEDSPESAAAKDQLRGTIEAAFAAFDRGDMTTAVAQFEAWLAGLPGDRVAEINLATAKQLLANGVPDDWDGTTRMTSK